MRHSVGAADIALPFLALFALLLSLGTLALLLSLLLPSRRLAAMAAGFVLVASFFLNGLAKLNSDLETLARLLPLKYYQSGDAINGLNLAWFGGLLAASALFAAAGWRLFQRRDIRVAGEGGWRLALRRRVARASA